MSDQTQVGDVGVLELLLMNGAGSESRDGRDMTPLHYCIVYRRPELAKALLLRGADRSERSFT